MPAAPAAEGVPQGGDDPARMRVHDGQVILRIVVVGRRDPLQPAVEIVRRDLAQHGVHELGPSVPEHDPGEVDRGGHGGMGGDPCPQQLMRPEAQHIEHRRVDLTQRPVHTRGDDRVVRPLPPQRSVHQLGRQRRVPSVELVGPLLLPGPAQQRWQNEVRVRVPFVHGPERLEGEHTDGVLLRTAVRLARLVRTTGLLTHEKGAPDTGRDTEPRVRRADEPPGVGHLGLRAW